MTVKTDNRSHRTAYMVVLLVFAVVLTTALVLAGERKTEGSKMSTRQTNTVPSLSALWLPGKTHV